MDERKRMLATAWRDLAGWSPGMMLLNGDVCTRSKGERTLNFYHRAANAEWAGDGMLPDPDAPPNWGVWLAWATAHVGTVTLGTADNAVSVGDLDVVAVHQTGAMAPALLCAVCRCADFTGYELPPSVTAWWEAEQKEEAS